MARSCADASARRSVGGPQSWRRRSLRARAESPCRIDRRTATPSGPTTLAAHSALDRVDLRPNGGNDMPQAVLDMEVVKRAVQLACRAPSVHNSQPCRWVHSADRSGREAIISCGAVLDHLRIAMVAAGWQAHIERFPNPNNRDHLASLEFSPLEFV